jgi:hypothetical protein
MRAKRCSRWVLCMALLASACNLRDDRSLSPTEPASPVPPPAPASSPSAGSLSSLSQNYTVRASTTESSLLCDPRGELSFSQTILIQLRVNGEAKTGEATVARSSTGEVSQFRGTVDSYTFNLPLVGEGQGSGLCGGGPRHETLHMRFRGPNHDGCQGFSGWIETAYDSAIGAFRETFSQESC